MHLLSMRKLLLLLVQVMSVLAGHPGGAESTTDSRNPDLMPSPTSSRHHLAVSRRVASHLDLIVQETWQASYLCRPCKRTTTTKTLLHLPPFGRTVKANARVAHETGNKPYPLRHLILPCSQLRSKTYLVL